MNVLLSKRAALLGSGALLIGSFASGFISAPPQRATGTSTVVSSQVIARDITTYTQQAQSVVLGSVVEVGAPYRFDLGENDESTIRHDVTMRVERLLNGEDVGSELTLAVEGGVLGQETVFAEDEAAFRVGERVLVFVAVTEDGDHAVFAGAYGKMTVNGDSVLGNADFRAHLPDLINQIETVDTQSPG